MLAIIGGSGLDQWSDAGAPSRHDAATRWGEASAAPQELVFGSDRCLFLPRHGGSHQFAPHAINYRANLQALHNAGATAVVAVNAVGGISAQCGTGALVLPHDLIDYTWGRAHTYFEQGEIDHVDFTAPYDLSLRQQLLHAADAESLELVDGGVYAATQGPRLETAAEIRRLQRDGCAIVGMTGMPEAALARELALPYAALCLVVNPAAGIATETITMAAISEVLERGMGDVRRVLERLIRSLG